MIAITLPAICTTSRPMVLDTAFELGGREYAGARLLVGMLEQVAHADADRGAQDEECDERGDRDQCQLQDDLGRRWQGRQVEHGAHGNKRPWGTEDCSGAVLPGAADLAHHRSRMWTGRTTCLGQAAIWARSTKQMTSNQRRPGFRLPWASESEAAEARGSRGGRRRPRNERGWRCEQPRPMPFPPPTRWT